MLVYAEDGVTVITAAGAIVTLSAYYRDLLTSGLLLSYDPYGGGGGTPLGVPASTQYAVTAGTASTAAVAANAVTSQTITTLTRDSIIALGTWPAGQAYVTTGTSAPHDGGEGLQLFGRSYAGAAPTVDGVRVFAVDTVGQACLKAPEPVSSFAIRSTTLPFSSSTDATAALENMLAHTMKTHRPMRFDPNAPFTRISSTVHVAPQSDDGGGVRDGGGGLIGADGHHMTRMQAGFTPFGALSWYGNSTDSMFALSGNSIVFRNIAVNVPSSKTLFCAFDALQGANYTQYNGVSIGCNPAQNGVVTYGIRIGQGSVQNNDAHRIVGCQFDSVDTGVAIVGGQPFMTIIRDCNFNMPLRPNGKWTGRGIWANALASSVIVRNAQFFGGVLLHKTADCFVDLEVQDNEYCKRLFQDDVGYGIGGAYALGAHTPRISLMRCMAGGGYDIESTLPAIDAGDHNAILLSNAGAIIENGRLTPGGQTYQPTVKVRAPADAPIVCIGMTFPNERPILRNTSPGIPAGHVQGTTRFLGCRYIDSTGTIQHMADTHDGFTSPKFAVTLSGTETSIVVAFPYPEAMTPVGVNLTVVKESGSPSSSITATATTITNRGFTLTLSSAPGAGNAVRVLVDPLSARELVNPQTTETSGASIVRGTATGAGYRGGVGWGMAVVTVKNPSSGRWNNVFSCSSGYNGFRLVSPDGTYLGIFWSGGTQYSITPTPFVTGDIGKSVGYVWTWDGTSFKAYCTQLKGSPSYSGAPTWTPAAGTARMVILSQEDAPAQYTDAFSLRCVMGGTGIPAQADVDRWIDLFNASGGIIPELAGAGVALTGKWICDGSTTLVNQAAPANTADNITTISGATIPTRAAFIPY